MLMLMLLLRDLLLLDMGWIACCAYARVILTLSLNRVRRVRHRKSERSRETGSRSRILELDLLSRMLFFAVRVCA